MMVMLIVVLNHYHCSIIAILIHSSNINLLPQSLGEFQTSGGKESGPRPLFTTMVHRRHINILLGSMDGAELGSWCYSLAVSRGETSWDGRATRNPWLYHVGPLLGFCRWRCRQPSSLAGRSTASSTTQPLSCECCEPGIRKMQFSQCGTNNIPPKWPSGVEGLTASEICCPRATIQHGPWLYLP